MTTQEFSDSFDTLLNSYNIQASFGEGASKFSITLDEYEKSVLLTQAQDIIIKSFFDARLNSEQSGMDTSERRQVDFSSLITPWKTVLSTESSSWYEEKTATGSTNIGVSVRVSNPNIYASIKIFMSESDALPSGLQDAPSTAQIAWASSSLAVLDKSTSSKRIYEVYINLSNCDMNTLDAIFAEDSTVDSGKLQIGRINQILSDYGIELGLEGVYVVKADEYAEPLLDKEFVITYTSDFDRNGLHCTLPTNILFILNERVIVDEQPPRTFVVVPLNYREYDREQSKAYAQPLKKQMWRLFHNLSNGYDISSEIIPQEKLATEIKTGLRKAVYYVRYIKRPSPIVLTDLPNGLTIDGVSKTTECTLNPILHMEILQKAYELALATRALPSSKKKSDTE